MMRASFGATSPQRPVGPRRRGCTRRTCRRRPKQVFPPSLARERIAFEIEKQVAVARLGQPAQPLLDSRRQQRLKLRTLRLPTQILQPRLILQPLVASPSTRATA